MSSFEVEDLTKEFDVPGGIEVAVDGVTISVEEGEFFSIVGPSGCGKTTTLRCFAGLETPTSGTVRINGQDVTEVPPNKRRIAMMFQNIALYPHMTIKKNIVYPLKVKRVSTEERNERAREAAEMMQIGELLDKYPGEVSGGQRQRAALARTVVQDPVAFLMDEPLSDLDAKLKIQIRKEIQRVHRRLGKATVYVTHDQEEAMTMSDRIAVMNDGRVEQRGSPEEIYHHPTNTFVAGFIGHPSMNFVDGTLESHDELNVSVTVNGHGVEFGVDYVDEEPTAEAVTVGFRPESVTLHEESDEGFLNADVVLMEPVGDRTLITLNADGTELMATVHRTDLAEGAFCSISADEFYLFDADGGDLLVKGMTRKRAVQ
jgi:multiple sugar transport system ATP-binding protein